MTEIAFYKGRFYEKKTVPGLFSYYERLSAWQQQSLQESLFPTFLSSIMKKDVDVFKVEIDPAFKKLGEEFLRLVKFYQHFCAKVGMLEAGALIFYHKKLNTLKFFIPNATCTGASWVWEIKDKLCALDGAEYTLQEILGAGYIQVGTTHSHNVMDVSWSKVDQDNQAGTFEKPAMTGIHILVKGFKRYKNLNMAPEFSILISTSSNGKLVDVPTEQIIDMEFVNEKLKDPTYWASLPLSDVAVSYIEEELPKFPPMWDFPKTTPIFPTFPKATPSLPKTTPSLPKSDRLFEIDQKIRDLTCQVESLEIKLDEALFLLEEVLKCLG